jgi:hypothetical protein
MFANDTLAYYKKASLMKIKYKAMTPIKKLWSKFTHSVCKLAHISETGKIVYNNKMVYLTPQNYQI